MKSIICHLVTSVLFAVLLQSCSNEEDIKKPTQGRIEIFAIDWSTMTRRALLPEDIIDMATERKIVYDGKFIDTVKNNMKRLPISKGTSYIDSRIVCLLYTEQKIDTLTLSRQHTVQYNSNFYDGNKEFSNIIIKRLSIDYQNTFRKFGLN